MILIEIEGGDAPRFRLEFHPRLTVVAGLDAVQRRELSLALRNVLTGQGRRMRLSVELDGEPQALTYDKILQLGLDSLEFDNIVNKASLGLDDGVPLRPRVETDVSTAEALDHAESALQSALVVVQSLEAQAAAFPPPPHAVDAGELAAAEGALTTARQNVEQLRKHLEEAGASAEELSPDEQMAKLFALKASIEERLSTVRGALADQPGDLDAIVAAMREAAASVNLIKEREELTALIAQAAGDWSRTMNELARLARQPRPPEWLVAQTKDQLDDAQARVKALTYQRNEGIDVERPLARAQAILAEVQLAWDEIEHGVEGQIAAALDRRDALRQNVVQLLGRDVAAEQILDALAAKHEELQSQGHPADLLVALLEQAGVETDVNNAHGAAEQLIARRRALLTERPDNQKAMAAAMVDLRSVNEQIAELRERIENPLPVAPDLDDQKARYEAAVADARTAELALKNLQLAAAEFASYDPNASLELRRKLQAAHQACASAQEHYEQLVARLQPAEQQPVAEAEDQPADAATSVRPWWEGGSPPPPATGGAMSADDIDVYLLARAAGMRMLVHGESMPLIIDAALEGLAPDAAIKTLEALSKISPIVQIIYLAGSDHSEKWAKRQDIYTTAVVRLERA